MEKTTRELSVNALAASAEEKNSQFSFFSSYKIPLFSLILFGVMAISALSHKDFSFGFKRQKSYRFNNDSLGFFIGDISFFANNSYEEAEEQIIKLFPDKMKKKVKPILRPVLVLCEKYQLDPFWVLSIMWTESHFRHDVTSKAGAKGLMQIMPSTFFETLEYLKIHNSPLEYARGEAYLRHKYPESVHAFGHTKLVSKLRHLEVGIYYLKNLLESFNNNHHYATVAYNMGPGWTKMRLKNNLPVGKKNLYLDKVISHYQHITKTLSRDQHNVAFIPRI